MDPVSLLLSMVTSGGSATIITQILKVTEELPAVLAKIPVVGPSLAWLVDTITPEDPASIRLFSGFVSFAGTLFMTYMKTGEASLSIPTILTGLGAFMMSQGFYTVTFKNGKVAVLPAPEDPQVDPGTDTDHGEPGGSVN